jgi:regulator of replication initiation timing
MAIAYAPGSIYPLLFEGEGATAKSSIAKLGAADFDALYLKVRKNLEDVLDQASSRSGMSEPAYEAARKLRERADTSAPESIIKACAEEMSLNKRLISGLVEHLISHIIIGEELRSIAEAARSRVQNDLERVTQAYIDFVHRLEAAGVVENNVRDMSKSQLARVLAVLKGTSDDEQMGVISQISEKRDFVHEIFKEGFEDGVESGAQANTPGVAHETGEVSPPIVIGDTDNEGAIDAATATSTIIHDPKGLWDDVDLQAIGYRIEEAEPSTVADREALSIILPETRVLKDWAVRGTLEYFSAKSCVEQRDWIVFEKFLDQHSKRTGRQFSEMKKRIISMLMIDVQNGPGGRFTARQGWFEGIVLPPKTGSSRVRRVVSIDRSDEALTMAYRPDEGSGAH